MSKVLSMRSVAHLIIGIVALALVAGLALAVSGDDPTVSFVNTAQEEGGEPGEDGEGREGARGHRCRGPFGGPLGHAIHGELIVPEPPEEGEELPEEDEEPAPTSFRTVEFDNGEVVEASDDSVTLERPDGERVTVSITEDTRVREDLSLEAGDKVHVVADTDGKALAIMSPPDRPEEGAEQGAEEGRGGGEGDVQGRPGRCAGGRGGPGGRLGPGRPQENSPADVSTAA